MTLPALPPALAASLIDALPSRLKRRASALAADCATWAVDEGRVTVGDHVVTVTFADSGGGDAAVDVTCSCLLSPKCAHVGAVAVAAPVDDKPEEAPEPEPAEADGETDSSDDSTKNGKSSPTDLDRRRELARGALRLVDAVLERGIGALSIADHAEGLALLQAARAASLPRLEKALTGVVGASRSMRTLSPPGRDDLARRVGSLAVAAHELAAFPESRSAVGEARRTYSALDGRGTGTFVPIAAEPVVAGSGFAGVVVTFSDGRSDVLQLAHTPPGDASDVPAAWHGRAALGDLHCSHAELARHRLLISGGRTSGDGRLGRGRGVRAGLGAAVTPEDLRGIDGYRVLTGTVAAADRSRFTLVETEPDGAVDATPDTAPGPRHDLSFSVDARRAGLVGVVEWMRAQETLTAVAGADDGVVVRMWGDDGAQIFPGLDRPPSTGAPGSGAATTPNERDLVAPAPGVGGLLADWLEMAVTGGAAALRTRERRVAADAVRIDDLAAPVAAELLRGLNEKPDSTAVARIHVYLRR